jgi:hypothetical protein
VCCEGAHLAQQVELLLVVHHLGVDAHLRARTGAGSERALVSTRPQPKRARFCAPLAALAAPRQLRARACV